MKLQEIARQIEKEWQVSGLSDSLYFDFAREVLIRFILDTGKTAISDASIKYIDMISEIFVAILEQIDDAAAKELFEFYESLF